MADPLALLREFVSSERIDEVVLSGDHVDFGGKFTFNKNVATGYKSGQGKAHFYDLETLLFFAKHVNIKFTEYFKKAGKEIGKQVKFVDRKDLQDYLTAKSERSEYIQLTVPELQVEQPAKRARIEAGAGEAEAGPSGAAALAEEDGEEAVEAAALRQIRENEHQLRDRNSMLSVPGRSFRKVLTILSQAQREQQKAHPPHQQRPAPKPVVPVRPSGRYERQTQQDATLRQLGAAELGVQVGFKPTAAATAGGVPPPPPPPPQQGAPPPPPPPPPPAAPHSRQQPPPPPPQQQQQHRSGGSSSRSAHAHAHQQQRHGHTHGDAAGKRLSGGPAPRGATPLIMVPPGMTALLNMYNIRSFLEQGTFKTTDQCKAEGVVKEDRIAIQRTIGRKHPVKYYVTDKEPSKADWGRVVAVICLGKAWQFKRWPFKGAEQGDLVDTFSRVMGVFVHYTDEQVDATVKSWNVKILGINRQSRHRDATVAQEFWRLVDAHLQARSSSLAY